MPHFELDRKALWGLYAVYAAIGTVNGFFATFLTTPIICQYLFGPLGTNVSIGQCNVAPSIFQISWNFKLFVGFFLDNFSFFGSRRKGWILFGWTGGLVMLLVNALLVDGFIEHKAEHTFSKYLYSLMAMCCFYTFSDVAGDGLIIEISKYEPDDSRGYILTTCQMIRFSMMMTVSIMGTLFMSGEYYQSSTAGDDTFVLPFEVKPFSIIHWILFAMALPFYIMIWVYLKEPPASDHHVRGFQGIKEGFGKCWTALQSYAMLMLLMMNIGVQGIAGLINPATQTINMVANPSPFQNALGASGGNVLFVIGVFLFRKYLLTYNWRITLVWTYALLATAAIACVMIAYDFGGFSQNGWFFMAQTAVPMLIQGLNQVLGCIAVIEIAPAGLEASIYELLISSMNGAQSLNAVLQTALAKPWNLSQITTTNWIFYHCAKNNGTEWMELRNEAVCSTYENNMAGASWMTLCINIGGISIFCWCMPKNAKHCREWRDKISWHTPWAAALNTFVFVAPFSYAIYGVFSAL